MITAKVLSLQNWYDISIQYTGSASNAFFIAKANDRSISSKLIVGEMVVVPDHLTISNKALQYLQAREIIPATGLTGLEKFTNYGIGSMIIENTFIIG